MVASADIAALRAPHAPDPDQFRDASGRAGGDRRRHFGRDADGAGRGSACRGGVPVCRPKRGAGAGRSRQQRRRWLCRGAPPRRSRRGCAGGGDQRPKIGSGEVGAVEVGGACRDAWARHAASADADRCVVRNRAEARSRRLCFSTAFEVETKCAGGDRL